MGTPAVAVDPQGGPEPTQKLASLVATRIENDIIAAGWPIGKVLGSEDDMRERYGVSRAVLREAIRLVEHHSAAVMRRGPNGGLVVRQPRPRPAIVAMVVYLEYAGTTVEHLLQARLALEPLAAALAADRITEQVVEELRAALAAEATHNAKELASPVSDFLHLKFAELSDNAPLSVFIDVLSFLTRRYAEEPARVVGGVRQVADEVAQAHHAIVDAIVEGNPGLAEHRTARHLEALAAWLKDQRAGPRGRRVEIPLLPIGASGKLAEVVAARIYDDVLKSDHPTGYVLGSETELLDRYQVSRAVLREAVRLLEHHSIARMRRGPGGGLVLAVPDPTASVKAMALYLEYRGYDVQQVRVARDAVELACLDIVTARAEDPLVRKTLEEVLDRAAAAGEDDAFAHAANDLHAKLGELSDNPALALFSAVLTALWERHGGDDPDLGPRKAAAARQAANSAHRAIVDAVVAGDAALARRRMRRHLDAMTEWWQ
jgi:DNA-binding FadR family transcriptional regulator